MARKRQFERDDVARGAMAVFWEKGYARTSLQDLEAATGVNKSGIYSEFRGKEDLFLAALRYYLTHRTTRAILTREPLGLENLRRFLEIGELPMEGLRGCFKINAIRELAILPAGARELIAESQHRVEHMVAANLTAAYPAIDAEAATDVTMTFFSGLTLEQNLYDDPALTRRRIDRFLAMLALAA